MKNSEIENDLEQFQELLNCPEQNWLLGAGISYSAKIPLMYPLTSRIMELIQEDAEAVNLITKIKSELPPNLHIEHILSHLGDYSAIASRTLKKEIEICKENFTLDCIEKIHNKILKYIADTIRYGYVEK
ncbi:TPA: SIR2 family protein, partial [Klebsiella pneumoniae]|nr:SIR2 family protein [Klebsiella pneumoniae]